MKPKKVLSIGYVGHRKGERLTRSAQDVQNDLDCVLNQIESAGQAVFEISDANILFHDGRLSFSAIGGVADGSDRMVIQALTAHDIHASLIHSCSLEKEVTMPEQAALPATPDIELEFEGKFRAHEQLIQARSDMLIAIWDGREKQGSSGGTVRAVHNALSFGIPVLWIHATKNTEPVLLTKREGETQDDLEKLLDCAFERQSCSEVDLQPIIEQVMFPEVKVREDKAFVRYLSGEEEGAVMNWLWDKMCIFSRFEWEKLLGCHEQDDVRELQGIARHLSNAEKVSGQASNRYRVSVMGLYILSAFAVFWAAVGYVFEESFHHFSEEYFHGVHIAGLAEIAVIVLIIFWFIWGDYRRWHGLWIHGRYLAEMLRMHQLLEPVVGVSAFMLNQDNVHKNWAHWLYRRYAIAEQLCGDVLKPLKVNHAMAQEYKNQVASYLQNQCDYHGNKVETEEVRHQFLHYGGYSFFVLTLLATVSHQCGIGGHEAAPWLTLTTIVLPALGAAFHAIMVQEEIERLIHTSKQMQKQLQRLKDDLPDSDIARLREVATRAADLMAGEAVNWHQMVGLKKLELPA